MVVDNNKMVNLKKRKNKQELNENPKKFVEINKEQEKKFSSFYKEVLKFIKNIEWAPWNIPLRRRLQTLAVGVFVFIFMGLPFVCIIFIALLAVSF